MMWVITLNGSQMMYIYRSCELGKKKWGLRERVLEFTEACFGQEF